MPTEEPVRIPEPKPEDPNAPFEPKLPPEYASLNTEEEEPAPKKSGISGTKKTFIYLASVLLAAILLALIAWLALDDICAFTREDQLITVSIPQGATASQVADKLKEAGLIRYPALFKIYCAASNAEKKIIPGTYDLNATFDYHALVNSMASAGSRATVTVMIPEGYTCEAIFALLEKEGVCPAEDLRTAAANTDFDYRFLEDVPLGTTNRLEGCLFPDTYEFYLGDNAENTLQKFLRNLDSKLTDELWTGLDDLNASLRAKKANNGFSEEEVAAGDLSMHDILTVASLIERETAGQQENPLIASVIYNRLCSKAYPYLNIDATIQYALPEHKEVLSNEDKLIDSPYNTYVYPGLPAGPIACPGMLAIRGAIFPQTTDYYFYALNKDGTHTFTKSYEEHLKFLESLEQ